MSEYAVLADAGIVGASVAISIAIIKVMDYLSSKKRNGNGGSLQRLEESTIHAHGRIDNFQGYCRDQHQKVERELGGITENVKAIKEDVSYLRNKADK